MRWCVDDGTLNTVNLRRTNRAQYGCQRHEPDKLLKSLLKAKSLETCHRMLQSQMTLVETCEQERTLR